MRFGRRLSSILLLALSALLVLAAPVLAYTYSATYKIVETNGTAYTMLPVFVSSNNSWMADNGFMKATALDTRVGTVGGSVKPHMVASDRTLAATAVGALSQTNLQFTTGNTDLTSLSIIPGYNGYLTRVDTPALELGADFVVEQKGYVDVAAPAETNYLTSTATGSDLNLYGALNTRAGQRVDGVAGGLIFTKMVVQLNKVLAPTGNITATVRRVAGDSIVGTFDTILNSTSVTGSNVEYTFTSAAGILNDATQNLRFQIEYSGGDAANHIHLDYGAAAFTGQLTYYNAGYTDVASDAYIKIYANATSKALITKAGAFITYVSAAGSSITSTMISAGPVYRTVTVTGLTSGERVVKTYISGGNMILSVTNYTGTNQGNSPQSVALAGASTTDTADNYVINQGNALPYQEYTKITVGGVLIAWYQPVTMIKGQAYSTGTVTVTNSSTTVTGAGGAAWTSNMVGSLFVSTDAVEYVVSSVTNATTLELAVVYGGGTLAAQAYNMYVRLPDRQGAAQDARITWGTNPAGVTVTLGSMVSASQPMGASTTAPPPDVLRDINVSDWYTTPDTAPGGKLDVMPGAVVPQTLGVVTSVSTTTWWQYFGLLLVVFVTVGTAKILGGHYFLASIACAASILFLVVMTIWPMWALIFMAIAIFAGWIAERMSL